jgi:hypothetical protein
MKLRCALIALGLTLVLFSKESQTAVRRTPSYIRAVENCQLNLWRLPRLVRIQYKAYEEQLIAIEQVCSKASK